MAKLTLTVGLLDKITGTLHKIAGSAQKTGEKLKKSFAAVSTVVKKVAGDIAKVGAAALANTILFNKAADEAGKFASRLGKSVETLTRYRVAAEDAGIASGTFDMSMQRLNRRVGQAITGTGEAAGVMKRFNLNARDFGSLPIDEQLGVLADKMGTVTSQQEKLAIAMALFDTEGVAMLQMLEQGREGMAKAAAEADRLGLTISDKAAANAAVFNTNLATLTGSLKGVANVIAAKLTPILSAAFKWLSDIIVELRPKIESFFTAMIDGFFMAAAISKQVLETIYKNIIAIFTDRTAFDQFLETVKTTFANIVNGVIELVPKMAEAYLNAFKVIMQAGKAAFQFIKQSITSIFSGAEAPKLSDFLFGELPAATAKAREDLKTSMDDVFSFYKENGESAGSAVMELLGVNVDAANATAEAWKASISKVGEATTEVSETANGGIVKILTTAQQAILNYIDMSRTFTSEFHDSLAGIFTGTVDNLSGSLANAIVTGSSLMNAFKQTAKAAAAEVIKSLIQIGIRKFILAKIFSSTIQAQSSQQLGAAFSSTFANAYSSTAAIPIVGPGLAPGVAAASLAAVQAGSIGAGAMGMSTGAGIIRGQFHAGIDNVPFEGSFLLDKGERVLNPRQNQDLTKFLSGQPGQTGGGAQVTIENLSIEVMPNATNPDLLMQMDRAEMRESIAIPIMELIEEAVLQGVVPQFVVRETS